MEHVAKTRSGVTLDHTLVGDLVFFEGPLVSLFRDSNGELFLYCWCDVDSSHNRWLVVRTNRAVVGRYLAGTISLRDIVLDPLDSVLYLIDLSADIQYEAVYSVHPADLPDSYIPEPDSLYDIDEFGSSDLFEIFEEIRDDDAYEDFLKYLLRALVAVLLNPRLKPMFTSANLMPMAQNFTFADANRVTGFDVRSAGISEPALRTSNLQYRYLDANYAVAP